MSRRGPPPLPSAVKRARGTYRPHRARGEPVAVPGRPKPPDFLGDDARREWNRIVPLLEQRGLLELVDRAILTGYCQAWGEIAEASRTLAEQGTTTIGPKGQLVAHPELRRLEVARQALRQYAQEFGLSPAARSRVTTSPAGAVDSPAAAARRRRFAALGAQSPDAISPARQQARERFFGPPPEREALRREFGVGE